MYGHICPECGAHLDPGERCDCFREHERRAARVEKTLERYRKMVTAEKDGQMKLVV